MSREGLGWFFFRMFFYHFVDTGLRVQVIFRKERTAENKDIDFEIEDISTSAHCYWSLKKISCRV